MRVPRDIAYAEGGKRNLLDVYQAAASSFSQVSTMRRLLSIPIYYCRLARLKRGGSVTLAKDLDGEDAAGYLKNFLVRCLKLPTER